MGLPDEGGRAAPILSQRPAVAAAEETRRKRSRPALKIDDLKIELGLRRLLPLVNGPTAPIWTDGETRSKDKR